MHSFKRRRRHWVFIIGAHDSNNLNNSIFEIGKLTNKSEQSAFISSLTTEQEKRDYLSLRNACLLYKALKKERLRELDLSICGFDKIAKQYKHYCLDSNQQNIIPKP